MKYREYDYAPAALHLRHPVNAYRMGKMCNKTRHNPVISYDRWKKMTARYLQRYSFQHLLAWLLLYTVIGPFLQNLPHASRISSISISLMLMMAVYAIKTEDKLFKYILGLMILTLVLFWIDMLKLVSFPRIISRFIMAIYIFMLVFSFTKYVFAARKVDSRLVSAALCLYLLIGTLWGVMYDILQIFVPGSFKGDLLSTSSAMLDPLQHFEYFSFVTLTTLGYGDILPQTQEAAALCQVEAIVGQFFMAVLVARLVGIQVSQEFSGEKREDVKKKEKRYKQQ